MGRPQLTAYVTDCNSIDLEQFEEDNNKYIDELEARVERLEKIINDLVDIYIANLGTKNQYR
jgi:signal transduction histidine kinase